LFVTKPAAFPYIEAAEEAIETSFQSLEIWNANSVSEGSTTKMSEASKMVARFMLNSPYQKGKGQELATNIRPSGTPFC